MKVAVASTLLLLVCLTSGVAGAQLGQGESTRSQALEIRLGTYLPDIDSEFSGVTKPYSDAFGSESAWLLGAEFDVQFWQAFGSLGVFGMLGYGWVNGNGMLDDGEKSSDETSLNLFPITAGLVYRFDVLATRFSVPLVLALKGGLNYSIWTIDDGVGDTSKAISADGKSSDGYGGTFGLYGGVALHVLLDVFEPHAATIFDNDLGVNNSYIFVEWAAYWVDDFGSSSSFDLSDGGLVFGLAFEM